MTAKAESERAKFVNAVRAGIQIYLKRELDEAEFADMCAKIDAIERGATLQDANFVIGDALFRRFGEFTEALKTAATALDRSRTITLWLASITAILLVVSVGYIEWLRRPEANLKPEIKVKRAFQDLGLAVEVRDDPVGLTVEFEASSLGQFRAPTMHENSDGNIVVEYRTPER